MSRSNDLYQPLLAFERRNHKGSTRCCCSSTYSLSPSGAGRVPFHPRFAVVQLCTPALPHGILGLYKQAVRSQCCLGIAGGGDAAVVTQLDTIACGCEQRNVCSAMRTWKTRDRHCKLGQACGAHTRTGGSHTSLYAKNRSFWTSWVDTRSLR